jgi:cysteine-S-conjugate beta-lyase
MYDFTTKTDRRHTGSVKWDAAPERIREAGLPPLSIADMEFQVAPAIKEAAIKAAEHGIYGYTHPDDEYFEAVKNYYIRNHGYEVQREWHTVTNGIVPALSIGIRAFSKEGEGIIVQSPVYTPFFHYIKLNGRKAYEDRLILKNGHYEMDFERLERLAARDDVHLMIFCSPHNPVGRVWTREEIQRVGEICLKNDVFLISDEIHCDVTLNGHKHHSFFTFPEFRENCMVCTAMSKTFNVAGLGCSDIFIPNKERREAFENEQLRGMGDCVLTYFARAVSIAAHNDCDDWVKEMRTVIEKNLDTLCNFLDTRLPGIKCIRAEGTYVAWIDMRVLGMSDEELTKLCLDADLYVTSGAAFGTVGSGFSRWNIALTNEDLVAALERFEKVAKPILDRHKYGTK